MAEHILASASSPREIRLIANYADALTDLANAFCKAHGLTTAEMASIAVRAGVVDLAGSIAANRSMDVGPRDLDQVIEWLRHAVTNMDAASHRPAANH